MIHTYYYGIVCAGKDCDQFNAIKEYQTNVHAGVADVDFESGHLVICRRCGFKHGYHTHDLVFSQKPDELVALDQ